VGGRGRTGGHGGATSEQGGDRLNMQPSKANPEQGADNQPHHVAEEGISDKAQQHKLLPSPAAGREHRAYRAAADRDGPLRMDARVGTAGADDDRGLLGQTSDSIFQRTLHRRSAGLPLEAGECGAVVLYGAAERSAHSTSSMMAMGAASPKRGPNLTIRVYPP